MHLGGMRMGGTRLVVVGGFLGAGKTTLLWQAARQLAARGMRVGLVTNDQASDLVDTRLLEGEGFGTEEVAGSCFCCNFPGLIQAARNLTAGLRADVILAEPVGSCADLSATLLQPLKAVYDEEFELAPFSVLIDPVRLREALTGADSALHPGAAYIVRRQVEEADVIVVNKVDELDPPAREQLRLLIEKEFPGREVRWLSALRNAGVAEWLDATLSGRKAGRRIAEVDYDRYAEGEASLGWLNAVVQLSPPDEPLDWPGFCRDLLEAFRQRFQERSAEVGHVKLLLSGPAGHCVGNLTSTGSRASLQDWWEPARESDDPLTMTFNARVSMEPGELERIVKETFGAVGGEAVGVDFLTLTSLKPGRPEPTFRYREVVSSRDAAEGGSAV